MVDIKELRKLTKNLSVLYVEDDPSICLAMTKYLKKFFRLVEVGSNGQEALQFYEKNRFDIVITDLSMPKMNGLDMIERIREEDENQLILITTAHSESEYLLSAIEAHTDGYIIKPFDYEALNYELFKIAQKIQKFRENEEYKEHLKEMLEQKTKEMSENYEKTLYSMVELIEQRDTYTAGHSKRVAHYCNLIVKEMGYAQEEATLIHQAAILHDVGKIETPDAVLLNPKRLNEIEYKLIQEHVNVSYKLLDSIPMFQPLAKIVYQHHERYDGSGYPNGLKGEEIEPLARVLIVADAFDAMTTNRIYKARKSVEVALKELVELSYKQFHPEVVASAVIALKDIQIDENISQLPKTQLEKERFAYFYKDSLSQAYNQNYLDVVLMKNNYEHFFQHLVVFSIHNFSLYNKKYSWKQGDELLREFADILMLHLDEALIFRVFGDDFVAISKKRLNLKNVTKVLDELIAKNKLDYTLSSIDLTSQKIEKLTDIETIQSKRYMTKL